MEHVALFELFALRESTTPARLFAGHPLLKTGGEVLRKSFVQSNYSTFGEDR
jgi:hypothetical protein